MQRDLRDANGVTEMPVRPRLIVDCDPGLDDAAAIAVAARYADLVGVTTVGGNAPLASVTRNALLTLQVLGVDVDVHSGAERPLVAPMRHAPEVHGEDGFAGPQLPPLGRRVASESAVEYIIETVKGEEGLWLVAVGPLTNIALALRLMPSLATKVQGISIMGGSATSGNATAAAEFNILVDPEAASAVLSSGAQILMAGLDLTHQFVVDDWLSAKVAAVGTPTALMLSDLMNDFLDKVERRRGERKGGLHDPVAVMAITHPDLIEHRLRRVDVELTGTHTRGMTVVDQRLGSASNANVHHGYRLDYDRAVEVLLSSL